MEQSALEIEVTNALIWLCLRVYLLLAVRIALGRSMGYCGGSGYNTRNKSVFGNRVLDKGNS